MAFSKTARNKKSRSTKQKLSSQMGLPFDMQNDKKHAALLQKQVLVQAISRKKNALRKDYAGADDATRPHWRSVAQKKCYRRFDWLPKFLFCLNLTLCASLVLLIFAEVKQVNKTPTIIQDSPVVVGPTSEKIQPSVLPQQKDAPEDNFLDTALNSDEATDYSLFEFENKLREKDPELEVPSEQINQEIARIDDLGLSNEEVYHLYEEKLPEDVLVHKEPVAVASNQPMIAIVIDDMGISKKRTKDISSLPYPINASFLTYADNLERQIAESQVSGQEIMAHLPMEPQVMQNFTPTMLTTSMSDEEIVKTLRNMLQAIPGVAAVNNHMGSKFTEDEHRMAVVMKELAARGLAFLDSKTTPHSAGPEQARKHGVKLTMRNVFLDNKDEFDYVMRQLKQTEKIARANGYAVAIGHPKAQTYLALKAWLPTLEEEGIKLVPLSVLSAHINH